jgi:RNA polymerase sigma-70 factor, ECF subfamily
LREKILEIKFEKLAHDYELLIYKVCRIYRHDPTDREDLFQEILIQLWKAFPAFRGDSKESTWVYRIALYTAIAGLRKDKKRIRTTDHEYPEKIAIADETSFVEEEKLKELYSAISHLNEIEKAIVMLYLEDRSYAEMEDILGIGQGNLRVKMNRIKDKLRQLTKEK